jgi:copper transport protein
MKINKAGIALFIVLIASLLITENVLAHALLVRSFPVANSELTQPPARIELWFSEPVEESFSSARLLSTSGEEIPVGTARIDPLDPNHLTVWLSPLSPGFYTVAWVSLSRTDGHEWSGSFPFTVLNPDGSRPSGSGNTLPSGETNVGLPTFAQTVSRWMALMGGILFMSVPLFLLFITPGASVSHELGIRFNSLGIKIVGAGVFAMLLGSWMQFALQAAQLGSLTFLPRLLYGTHAGFLALARQALALGGFLVLLKLVLPSTSRKDQRWIFITATILEACILFLTLISSIYGEWVIAVFIFIILGDVWGMAWYLNRISDSSQRQSWILLLGLGFVTLSFFSIGSHANAVPGRVWAILSDYIHLLATSAWMGGLMLLPIMLEQMNRFSSLDRKVLGLFFRRYGYMAKFSFFLLLTTGVFNSLVHFPTWISLVTTSYGQVLLVKLLLLSVVWWVSLRSNAILRRPSDPSALSSNIQRFIHYIALAVLIGFFAMASVAALVQTQPPPRTVEISQPADFPFIAHNQVEDLTIHFQVTPTQVGSNHFKVFLFHEDNSPIGAVQLVRLLFDYQDEQIGQSSVDLKQQDVGVFGIEGAYLNQPGSWKLSIYVRRRGMDDILANMGTLTLAPVQSKSSLFQNPVTTIPLGGLLAGAMIIVGAEIFRWRKTIQQVQPALVRYYLYLGGLLILVGLGFSLYWLLR